MAKNMKIKTYLILAFGLILILMSVLGVSSVFFSQTLAKQTIQFYEQPHTVQLQVAEVRRIMSSMGGDIKEALIYRTPEMTNTTTTNLGTKLEDMNKRIGIVQQQFTGDQNLIKTADQQVQAWLAANEQLRVAMESQKYDVAQDIFFNQYIPAEKNVDSAVQKISDSCEVSSLGFYNDAKENRMVSFVIVLILLVVAILATFVICTSIIRSIMVPLNKVEKTAQEMAKGNLHYELDFQGRNEFGRLADSMRGTMTTLAQYVDNIDSVLERMSSNDMTVSVDMEYIGDFAPIRKSLEKILFSLNNAMLQIQESSDQVAEHAHQISMSGQTLAQGATEQAGSVQELSASIDEISEQVRQSAVYTDEIDKLVEQVGTKLTQGSAQMSDMLTAISEINNASDQIAKIIKTIEDIAFQTNILALNAAVEAARAGAAGKGFAVVADEVRNLAAKSGAAAKSTTELIQNSIRAVGNGTRIADETAKTMGLVVEGAGRITGMVNKITLSSKDQSSSLTNISSAVEQISQVVATTSASAEESAASSEELNSQAQVMRSLANSFKLKNSSRKQLDTYASAPRKELKAPGMPTSFSATDW